MDRDGGNGRRIADGRLVLPRSALAATEVEMSGGIGRRIAGGRLVLPRSALAATEVEVSGLSGDAEKLASMCDALLLENEMLQRFAASLDVESLAEVHSRSPALGLMSSLLSHCLVIVSQAVQGARHGWHRLH